MKIIQSILCICLCVACCTFGRAQNINYLFQNARIARAAVDTVVFDIAISSDSANLSMGSGTFFLRFDPAPFRENPLIVGDFTLVRKGMLSDAMQYNNFFANLINDSTMSVNWTHFFTFNPTPPPYNPAFYQTIAQDPANRALVEVRMIIANPGATVEIEFEQSLSEGKINKAIANPGTGPNIIEQAINDPYTYDAALSFTTLNVFDLNLRGEAIDKQTALLSWEVDETFGWSSFVLEKRHEGSEMTELRRISPTGEGSYAYADEAFGGRRSWYRLRGIDADGETHYSPTIMLTETEIGVTLWTYPNPATDHLNLVRTGFEALKLEIYDAQGRRVLNRDWPESEQGMRLELDGWASGVYYYTWRDGLNRESGGGRFVKQ